MKLLLTSTGFANQKIADFFLDILRKDPTDAMVAFIPTASRTEEELFYVRKSKQELLDMGIKKIVEFDLENKPSSDPLSGFDIVYVCGGNTYYLLKKIRNSGFDVALNNFNGLYVGVSAGSIVVGPSIEIAGPWDENDISLEDESGMNIIDFAVSPHYQRKDKEIIAEIKSKVDYEILELTDNQAIFCENGKRKIIE
jgi:peptidase E